MKKIAYSRFLARAAVTLLAVFSFSGAWADEVEIGDGTSTTKYVPIGTYYNYSITEQLYTADEIGTAGTITSISFHYTGAAAKDLPITMYMKHVDEADLASAGITLADADEVFNGTLSVTTTAGWVTITLDTPFEYDGESNLLIGINKGYVYYFNGDTWYCTATESQMTRYTQSDSAGPYDTSTVPGTAQANRPNIKIEITPSAGPVYKKPTDLIVSDLTSTGATISWTAPEGSPTGYAYQYKKASDADWSAETSVTATSVALSGLEPAKAYNFRVKAVYGTDGVSGFTSTNFTTDCDVITTFPWTDDFESYEASGQGITFDHPCWVNEHISGSGSYFFEVYSGNPMGGNSTKLLRLHDMTSGTMTKLVLPEMTLPGDNYMFSIDVYRNNSQENYGEGIRVFVSTDGDIEGATELAFISRSYTTSDGNLIPAESASGWYTYEIPLGISGTCYIILRGESKYGGHTYMDNFAVMQIPSCKKPTLLTASNISAYEATISWTSDADAWQICVNDDEENLIDVTENPYTLTGLTPETAYTVKVRTNCGADDKSYWSKEVSFTTNEACPTPTDLYATAVRSTSADVAWTGSVDVTDYTVRYRVPQHVADGIYETFDANFTPTGWSVYTGKLNEDGTATLNGSSSGFSFGPSNEVFDSHARINIYSNYQRWLITPRFTLAGSTLSFDMALTAYSGSVSAPATNGDDDRFIVLISIDNMAHWTILREWNNSGSEYVYNNITCSKTGEQVSISLNDYIGQNVHIAFYGESTEGNADNNLHIDNVLIGQMVPATEWQTVSTTETNATLTGLTPTTDYEVQVKSNCSDPEAWSTTLKFTTLTNFELANDDSQADAEGKNSAIIAANAGKGADVTLSGRTLYKDGNWNTICLPFDLALEGSPLEGATAKTLTNATMTGTHVELTFGDDVTTLQAGKPYIIKWEAGQENIVDPTFTGVLVKDVDEEVRTLSFADYQVQFIGYYDAFNITPEDEDIFYMTAGSQLKATGIDRTLKSCRAYFQFSEEAQKARQFVLNFGDGESTTTGIASMDNGQWTMDNGQWSMVNGQWYDLQGRRVSVSSDSSVPSVLQKGVYIQNGRKVVIK